MLTLHVDMIMKLQQDRDFYDMLDQFDVITCDSQIMYFATKWLRTPVQGAGFGIGLSSRSITPKHADDPDDPCSCAVARDGIAEIAAKNINAKVGREIIVGTDAARRSISRNPREASSA